MLFQCLLAPQRPQAKFQASGSQDGGQGLPLPGSINLASLLAPLPAPSPDDSPHHVLGTPGPCMTLGLCSRPLPGMPSLLFLLQTPAHTSDSQAPHSAKPSDTSRRVNCFLPRFPRLPVPRLSVGSHAASWPELMGLHGRDTFVSLPVHRASSRARNTFCSGQACGMTEWRAAAHSPPATSPLLKSITH